MPREAQKAAGGHRSPPPPAAGVPQHPLNSSSLQPALLRDPRPVVRVATKAIRDSPACTTCFRGGGLEPPGREYQAVEWRPEAEGLELDSMGLAPGSPVTELSV